MIAGKYLRSINIWDDVETTMSGKSEQLLWQEFTQRYGLTEQQEQQFKTYYAMLQAANAQFDLTAITELSSVLAYHFADSLEIGKYLPLQQMRMIADVGSGAGFPGLALKIAYPTLPVVLIEVTRKRIEFLESVIQVLQLTGIEVYPHDWRTFLRKTEYPIDLFCARASLQPSELLRLLQPGSFYKNAQLAYWAAADWQPVEREAALLLQTFPYTVKNKKRLFAVFGYAAGHDKKP
jgi:16S rRNA (guanine527-N7)-methyltransferase